MTHTTLLWGTMVSLLLLIFIFRIIQSFRHETKDWKLIEWEKDDIIHYEEDDEDNL